jgi:hypothetical protein
MIRLLNHDEISILQSELVQIKAGLLACGHCGQGVLLPEFHTETFHDGIVVEDMERYRCNKCGGDPVYPSQIRRNEKRMQQVREIAALQAENAQLKAELQQAKADVERLDTLESLARGSSYSTSIRTEADLDPDGRRRGGDKFVLVTMDESGPWRKVFSESTLRAAIDAAKDKP